MVSLVRGHKFDVLKPVLLILLLQPKLSREVRSFHVSGALEGAQHSAYATASAVSCAVVKAGLLDDGEVL